MTRSTDGPPSSVSSGADDPAPGPAVPPRFAVGDEVTILAVEQPGHVRTPRYARGTRGAVTAVHGRFRNPESLGHGGDGLPERWLYQVALAADEVWDQPGSVHDVVCVDIFEHWLRAGAHAETAAEQPSRRG